ncbi:MAG: hypothetical protein IJF46_04655 [Bacteroidaceae bacterium]|nr:hypothetical protein [Bacteroidaceae bacterium]
MRFFTVERVKTQRLDNLAAAAPRGRKLHNAPNPLGQPFRVFWKDL